MHPVSYILDGSHMSEDDEAILSKRSQHLRTQGLLVEFIIYTEDREETQTLDGLSIIQSHTTGITSFEKAVASASGEILIFTSLRNAVLDSKGHLAFQASTSKDYHVAVPTSVRNSTLRISGIRHIDNAKYWFVSKKFAFAYIQHLSFPRKLIREADKQLALRLLNPVEILLPDVVIRHFTFSRPYVSLARHYGRMARIKCRNYRNARRDERLSRRVPPVPFSVDMPVFIICRDRVEPLKKLVRWCKEEGLTNIYFIDNASTYAPLKEYLSSSPYEVIYLRANLGHTSPWIAGIVNIYAKDRPFIVTDPDVIPVKEAHGAVRRFCELLTKYPERRKVGFGLKIDDLPEHYQLKKHVISWEKQFWVTEIENEVYDAEIDTTFAVYRQNTPYVLGPSLRTGGKFVARHEPWYINSNDISEEVIYYRSHADKKVGSWGTNTDDVSETYTNNEYLSS